MVVAAQLRRSSNSVPFLISISDYPTPKSFTCHTSGKSPVSPSIATLPKTRVSILSICHTYEAARGAWTSPALRLSNAYSSSWTGLRDPQTSLIPRVTSYEISRRPSPFCSATYKMLFAQLLCFENDPFSWGGCTLPLLSSSKSIVCASAAIPPSRGNRKTQNENQKNFSFALWCGARGARPLRSAPDFAWLQHC